MKWSTFILVESENVVLLTELQLSMRVVIVLAAAVFAKHKHNNIELSAEINAEDCTKPVGAQLRDDGESLWFFNV